MYSKLLGYTTTPVLLTQSRVATVRQARDIDETRPPHQNLPSPSPSVIGIILIIFSAVAALGFLGSLAIVGVLAVQQKPISSVLIQVLTSSFTFILGLLSANLGLKEQIQPRR